MANKAGTFFDVVTWLCMTNNGVVFNNNKTIQKTFIFEGKDNYRMTPAEQEIYVDHLNNVFKRLKTGYILFWEAQKITDTEYMDESTENSLTAELDEIRKDNLTGGKNFIKKYYLTICYRQPSELLQRLEKIIDKDNKTVFKEVKSLAKEFINVFNPKATMQELEEVSEQYQESFERLEENFLDEVNNIVSLLNRHFSSIRALTNQETLTYLHSTISDSRHNIKAPYRTFISQNLSDSPFVSGLSPKIGDKYIGVVGVKDLPAMCHAFMFDKLDELKSEYRFCTRYIAFSKEDGKKECNAILNGHNQRSKGLATMVYEMFNGSGSGERDAGALQDADEVKELMLELEQDTVGVGYLTTEVVLLNKDQDVLKEECDKVREIVQGLDFIAVNESYNASSAWLSTIPSVYELNVRKYLSHSLTFASCAPISARWEGQKKNKHFERLGLQSMPLMKCRTPEHLPFYLNLHVEETGHTFIAGVTGTGKSVLLNAITCNFLKYRDANIFIFDKSASSRVLTQAMGGNFYNLLVDNRIAFQPLANIDDDQERTWVFEWLKRYARGRNITLSPQEEDALKTALDTLAGRPKELRTMTTLSTVIQSPTWRSVLSALVGSDGSGGAYGQLYDSDVDRFGSGNWQAFEMEKLMENESILAPTLDYLFHRIDGQLSKRPTLIILDECWLFLRNKEFRLKIAGYIKDLRKKNASVIMATQNLSDITEDLKPIIAENMLTKIFLSNEGMTTASEQLYRDFGLNDKEIEIIKTLTPRKEYYYKSQLGSRQFDLNLSDMELAFLGSTNKIDQEMASRYADLTPEEFISTWKRLKGVAV